MKTPEKRVFSLARENAPMPGCTASRSLCRTEAYDVSCFSLAAGTSISAQSCPGPRLWLVSDGALEVSAPWGVASVCTGDLCALPLTLE